jgi:thiamine transport system ATP-binding protein
MPGLRGWEGDSVLEFRRSVILNAGFTVDADWSLPAGSLAGIVGPSGAGKSTLLNALAGFLTLKTGEIWWEGERLDQTPPEVRPVAMVFQDNNLFPHLSAASNIAFARPGLDAKQIEDAMTSVGLEGLTQRKPGELSGGQQARVALARSLLMKRPILLMDEPFSALGPGQRREMLRLVADLARAQGLTLLIVTHEPRDLDLLDHVILVDAGIAQTPVPRETFLESPPKVWRDYIGVPE